MPWQNLLDFDPATVFDVYRDETLVDPGDYASLGITVDVVAGRVTLTYPDIDAARWEILARPSAPIALPLRLFEHDGTPWATSGQTEPYLAVIFGGNPPPPEQNVDLNAGPLGTELVPVGTIEAFGMGRDTSPA